MSNLYIEKSKSTPTVKSQANHLTLEGVALPEDSKRFFEPILNWVNNFDQEELMMNINLYYFNTSVSKILLEMMKVAEKNTKIKHIEVNWHYEVDDIDMLEAGEMYEGSLKRTTFNFIEMAEVL